jgi:xanthine dehydrogenase YagS FAD-binding subunit
VEELLVGNEPSDALFDKAADVLLAEAKGQGANDFKIPMTRRVLKGVLREATGRAV